MSETQTIPEADYATSAMEARAATLKAHHEVGLVPVLVARRHKQALNAGIIKAKFDGGPLGSQEWVYSKRLADHKTRLAAAKLAYEVWDAMPSQRIEHSGGVTILDPDPEVNMPRKDDG